MFTERILTEYINNKSWLIYQSQTIKFRIKRFLSSQLFLFTSDNAIFADIFDSNKFQENL